MADTFRCGFVYGIIAAGILGFILNNIRTSLRERNLAHRPLDTFPDASQPNLTAAGIVNRRFGLRFPVSSGRSCWFLLLI